MGNGISIPWTPRSGLLKSGLQIQCFWLWAPSLSSVGCNILCQLVCLTLMFLCLLQSLFTFVNSFCAFAMHVKDLLLLLIGRITLSEFSIFSSSGLNLSFMKSWIFMFYLKYSVAGFLITVIEIVIAYDDEILSM